MLNTPDASESDVGRGDLNQDGLDDLVVVRKGPDYSCDPRFHGVLLNRGGVLQDVTPAYCPDFLSHPSPARDVAVGDLDGDGYPEVVVGNTCNAPPELYRTKGLAVGGGWAGLERAAPSWLRVEPGTGQGMANWSSSARSRGWAATSSSSTSTATGARTLPWRTWTR